MNKLEKIKEINEKFQIEHLPLLYSVKKSLYSKNNDNIYYFNFNSCFLYNVFYG